MFFDKNKYTEHAKEIIYMIVSNIHFPKLYIRFVKGKELIKLYPKAKIPYKDHNKFFKICKKIVKK